MTTRTSPPAARRDNRKTMATAIANAERTSQQGIYQLSKLFKETIVGELLRQKNIPIITVDANASVSDAITALSTYRIQSAPVKEGDKMIGLVDVMDIVAFAVKAYRELPSEPSTAQNWYIALVNMSQFGTAKLATTRIKDIMNLSGTNPAIGITYTANVYELTKYVLANGVHRVPILDENNTVMGMLSQSDILKFVCSEIENLGKLAKLTLEQLQFQIGVRFVVKVTTDSPVIKALELMDSAHVTAVAVVDSNDSNNLVANLSASDIKGLQTNLFSTLTLPIYQYFALNSGMFKPVMTCKLSSTIETIVLKLIMFRMHRLWVIDDKDTPIGVITLTDVMKLLAKAVEDDIAPPPFMK